jgi:hypothetical protein
MDNIDFIIEISLPIVLLLCMICYMIKYNNMRKYLAPGDHVWYRDEDGKRRYGVIDRVYETTVTIRPESVDGVSTRYPIKELTPVIFIKYKK